VRLPNCEPRSIAGWGPSLLVLYETRGAQTLKYIVLMAKKGTQIRSWEESEGWQHKPLTLQRVSTPSAENEMSMITREGGSSLGHSRAFWGDHVTARAANTRRI